MVLWGKMIPSVVKHRLMQQVSRHVSFWKLVGRVGRAMYTMFLI